MMFAWDRGSLSADGSSSEWLWSLHRTEEMADEVRCAARHLAVAASQLSRDECLPRDVAARFAAAETRFRSQATNPGVLNRGTVQPGPVVSLSDGATASMSVLFASLCHRDRWWLPKRSIDPDLILAAKELLTGLEWYLPDTMEVQRSDNPDSS
jgi:hypothetical protein